MIDRRLLSEIDSRLRQQPAAVLLGPRQVGKTTLARQVAALRPDAVFLDMEDEADRARLAQPAAFFGRYRDRLVVIDEVQALPEIFSALRPEIDAERRPGRFLLLGSASGKLLRQSSESLAGRVAYLELTPFLIDEVGAGVGDNAPAISRLWLRGGFPQSFLAVDDAASLAWRADLSKTLLTRDLPQLGVTIPAETLRRFWRMCAHLQGQVFNASQLGLALGGVAHTTVGRYLDLMVDALMLRRLEPWHANVGKRLVKSPKVFVRDSGLLHALLGIATLDDLAGHPVAGLSWEGFLIEQLIAHLPPLAEFGFYRTAAGAELDLVVENGGRRIGYEIKLSNAPRPARGFWTACEDLGLDRAWVIAPVREGYPLADKVEVIPPQQMFATLA
ncbi:MAG: ATPase [Rhodocyclales bacterium RIFCSPLOWO2_02_FULL_63_24]|nr:MAG: ATPase [Rhodocyclales bacterium GWA2_65_19]OHC68160.1 MAG: ATPase [Rhodocyclales bacterium RIFCSPLOWO2_02_FULL_63_24]